MATTASLETVAMATVATLAMVAMATVARLETVATVGVAWVAVHSLIPRIIPNHEPHWHQGTQTYKWDGMAQRKRRWRLWRDMTRQRQVTSVQSVTRTATQLCVNVERTPVCWLSGRKDPTQVDSYVVLLGLLSIF